MVWHFCCGWYIKHEHCCWCLLSHSPALVVVCGAGQCCRTEVVVACGAGQCCRTEVVVACDAGQCCWTGEEPGPDGIHLRRLTAFSDLGVPGRVEHGEPRGNCSVRYCRVRYLFLSFVSILGSSDCDRSNRLEILCL